MSDPQTTDPAAARQPPTRRERIRARLAAMGRREGRAGRLGLVGAAVAGLLLALLGGVGIGYAVAGSDGPDGWGEPERHGGWDHGDDRGPGEMHDDRYGGPPPAR